MAQDQPPDQPQDAAPDEAFNPWSVVNLVFDHLAKRGLHPQLGDSGDPSGPAAELLRCLNITPAIEGVRTAAQDTQDHLAALRAVMMDDK